MRRRDWLTAALAASMPSVAAGQGIASRGVRAAPRGKPSGIPFLARFTDVGREAGLVHPVIYGDPADPQYILEVTGCGVAFLDYDNDGWLDILVLNGQRLSNTPAGTSNRLYRNNRNGTFTDVTAKAGLTRMGWASSVTVGDFNNDGHEDLFITYYGQNVLYRNNGDGTFTDVTRQAGLVQEGTYWGSGCTWLDYNRDGHLDLFIANYIDFDVNKIPRPGSKDSCNWKGIPTPCGPRGLSPGRQWLYRNNGDGTFTDVSDASGISKARSSYAMTAVAADFDNDGWSDIYVACDSTASFLFRNQRDGTFREEALARGTALSEDGMVQAGMGLGVGDYNCDGHLDLFKTHFAEDTHGLYRNDGKGFFDDVTLISGLGVETRYVGWGAAMLDLDNDGWPDLFFVTGNPYPGIHKQIPTMVHAGPRLIFRNLGNGKFEELLDQGGPGLVAEHPSRGAAFGDFDNDGDVDIVIVNMNEPPSLLRNDLSGDRNWLKVQLVGTKSNRSAIGSSVTVSYAGRKQTQAVLGQSSFYSVNDRRLHFGLGDEKTADILIRWASGGEERFEKVAARQWITIREGQGIVTQRRVG